MTQIAHAESQKAVKHRVIPVLQQITADRFKGALGFFQVHHQTEHADHSVVALQHSKIRVRTLKAPMVCDAVVMQKLLNLLIFQLAKDFPAKNCVCNWTCHGFCLLMLSRGALGTGRAAEGIYQLPFSSSRTGWITGILLSIHACQLDSMSPSWTTTCAYSFL